MNRDADQPAPVFVVGMNGSGTTMMLDCLDSHPEFYGFPRETLVIPRFIDTVAGYGNLENDDRFRALWDAFRGLSCFRWINRGEIPPLPADWRERPRNLASVVDGTFRHFADGQGKRRWCEKTPMHAQHIAALHGLFPGASFVHMIRDGRSCAASFNRRWGYIPGRTIFRWKNVIRAAREQAEQSGAHYIEVFYEQLTSDPESQMRRVCGFLGVEYDEKVLRPSRERRHTGSTSTSISASRRKWDEYFDARRIAELEGIAGKTLAELGYEAEDDRGDRNPSRAILRWWMLRDYLRMGVRVLWKEITTPREEKWDDLGGRIRSAIRQRRSSKF